MPVASVLCRLPAALGAAALGLALASGCGGTDSRSSAGQGVLLKAGKHQRAQAGGTLRVDVREPARAASRWHLTDYDSLRLELLGSTRRKLAGGKGWLRRYRLLARRPGRASIVLKDSLPNTGPPVEVRRYHVDIRPLEDPDSAPGASTN